VNLESPGGAPNEIVGGTAAALLAERHHWEEAVRIFITWTTVEQALKKQIITAFEPMYLEILNNDIVGFANTTSRDMLEHLFLSYGIITTVDLEHNWENMRKAWDPHQPVESLFKKIQDCVDYAEAGGSPSVRHKSSRLRTPRSLQLESSTVLGAVGMTYFLQSRLGMRSKLTLQWPIASKSNCRGKQLLPPGTPTPLWHNLLMKI
jgi:hypothetical protein